MSALPDTPRFTTPAAQCVDRFGAESEKCSPPVSELMAAASPLEELAAGGTPGENFSTMDMTDHLYPDGICRQVIGNVLIDMDQSHHTSTYVRTTAVQFEQCFLGALTGLR